MKRKIKAITIGCIICILVASTVAILTGVFGIPSNNVEQDARKSQKIESTWKVSKSINSQLCAMIFYDDALNDYTYSIYLNRAGLSFGYFFRSGGSNNAIMDGIHEFTYDANGSALISMNKDKVAKIKLYDGKNMTTVNIDPAKPFAAVIPMNCGSVTLYDVNGRVVPITVVEANG